MIERGGAVVIRMLENVQQMTIKPLIQATIAPGTLVYTDEYDIYSRLEQWCKGVYKLLILWSLWITTQYC